MWNLLLGAQVPVQRSQGLKPTLKQGSMERAAGLFRGLVDETRLTPADGRLSIAVKGNLAGSYEP
jgi:hypothetical protein